MDKHSARQRFLDKFDILFQTLLPQQQGKFTSSHTFYDGDRLVYDAEFWHALTTQQQRDFAEIRDEYQAAVN
jgi:TRAP-type C4-dicarboxylate transport system substrate-binding protein